MGELARISKEINAPLLVNMIKGSQTPLVPAIELQKMGFKIAIYPNEVHRATIWAIRACLNCLREKGTTENFDTMIDFSSREEIVGTAEWQRIAEKYTS